MLGRCGQLFSIAFGFIALGWFGCGPAPTPSSGSGESKGQVANPTGKSAADLSANDILRRLLDTYRQAKSYQDQGVVRLSFRQQGEPVSQEWPVAVALARPNRLSVAAYQAIVKCDGKELKARFDDPVSNNVDNQVVVRPAPSEFKLADLASDPLLYDTLISRLRRQPIQLELLFDTRGLVSAFGGDIACQRRPDQSLDGRTCFGVEVPSPGGPFVFWVDQADFLLRRLDYPAAALFPEIAGDSSISELRLTADLRGATIGGEIPPSTFAMEVPPSAKRMKTFVRPPQPLPTKLLGQTIRDFFFTELGGQRISSQALLGKVAVLAWYHDNPACAATLLQVAAARQRLASDSKAVFLAVATDPTATSDDVLRQRLRDWKVELPVARDLEAFGDKSFHIELQPTIVVLDGQGRVQIFETGGNPQLADQLVSIVQRLEKGENLAADILAAHEAETKKYNELVASGGPEPEQFLELPEAAIHAKSEPKHLKLSPLWTSSELKSPGNILVVESANDPPRIFVAEGWQTVTELNAAGQIVARRQLELPPEAAVTFLRTAADKTGRRYFVGSAPMAAQLFVFDEAWKPLSTFVSPEPSPLQVCDLGFAELGDAKEGLSILVASVNQGGLTALAPSGEVRWRNRTYASSVSLAVTRPDDIGSWAIFVTGESGSVLRVNRFGQDESPVTVGKWPILRLIGSRFADAKKASLVGLSNNEKGDLFAIGLTDQLKECWNYPLPPGIHQRPIEAVTSSHLLPGRQGEWWVAGPDGSIHVISEDGDFYDSFFYGAVLNGIAATRLDRRSVLLVATDAGLSAWEVSATKGQER